MSRAKQCVVLCLCIATFGIAACSRDQEPARSAEGMIRKGDKVPDTNPTPEGVEQASHPQIDQQLKTMPGWNNLGAPPPHGSLSPEVQKVLKTVDEVNRINAMNKRNN